MATWRTDIVDGEPARRRRVLRYVAAAIAALIAVLYLLIGVEVLRIVDAVGADDPSLLGFGVAAGSAYLLGAILLVAFDRRILWVLGALLQVVVIVMYVVVGPQRSPSFEVWGLLIKVLQLVLLGALLTLALRQPAEPATDGDRATVSAAQRPLG